MRQEVETLSTRRALIKNGAVLGAALLAPGAVTAAVDKRLTSRDLLPTTPPLRAPAQAVTSPRVVRPELMRRALAALDRHGASVKRDRMAVVDFAARSAEARFHFVDLRDGRSTSMRVAHGSGSDPSHTGWLKRFSNEHGSNASCEGAFLCSDYYHGKHGKSQRLVGLDPTNNNALGRAIVIHGAWYVNPDMVRTHGMLGRSQGCFAFAEAELEQVFARLGAGRMIYAAKV